MHTHLHLCIAGSRDETDFRFSVSQLPPWAQKQLLSRPSVASKVEERVGGRVLPTSVNSPAKVYGKWAEVRAISLYSLVVYTCACVLSIHSPCISPIHTATYKCSGLCFVLVLLCLCLSLPASQRVADMGAAGHITLAYGSPMEEVLRPGAVEGDGTLSVLNVEGVEGEEGAVEESESDGEEEIVYPVEGKAVDEDAELFKVTSPVKVTLPEQVDSSEVIATHKHTLTHNMFYYHLIMYFFCFL